MSRSLLVHVPSHKNISNYTNSHTDTSQLMPVPRRYQLQACRNQRILETTCSFLNTQFRREYLQTTDRVHPHLSFGHVFPSCQVSILGKCFYSLARIPRQATHHCWVSLMLCASISKTFDQFSMKTACAVMISFSSQQGKFQHDVPEDSEELVNL